MTYDNENHLVAVQKNGVANFASFVYGPGGERVKGTVDGVTTIYVGTHFEKILTGLEAGTERKYYYAGSQRIAMRQAFDGYFFLLGDHLGSTTVTASSGNGSEVGAVLYKAWGEERYSSGTVPTTYRYTGQREESYINMYLMGFRWYDPALGRFVQPDTIIPQPGDPQQLNRFSWVRNNPLRYTDPTGHKICEYCAGEGDYMADRADPPPTPEVKWLDGDFTVTYYTYALERDPLYANDAKVSANGLDEQYREGFLFGESGITKQGTGLAESGQYLRINWNPERGPTGVQDPVQDTWFDYGQGGSFGQSVPCVKGHAVCSKSPQFRPD